MVKLDLATDQFAPVSYGEATLAELSFDSLWSVHGLNGSRPKGFPATGTHADGAYWSGHRQWMLRDRAKPRAGRSLAVVDQSGGWRVFTLSGATAGDVLARLCQVDLRDGAFPVGAVARAECAHLMSLIARVDAGYELWFMRSYARNAHHHITDAMKSLAAQARIGRR